MNSYYNSQPALPGFESFEKPRLYEDSSFSLGQQIDMDFRITADVYHSGDFRVFVLKADGYRNISCTLNTSLPLEVGRSIHVVGKVIRYKDKLTIRGTSCIAREGLKRTGVIEYLANHYPGIGRVAAGKIFDMFGDRTFEIVEKEPEKLIAVPGIGKATVNAVAQTAENNAIKRDTLVFLSEIGVTKGIAAMIWERFKDQTKSAITKNPYILTRVGGIGFKRADEIALGMGFSKDTPERIREGILYALENECSSSGHCYLDEKTVLKRAETLLEVSPLSEREWMKTCSRIRYDGTHVYPKRYYDDEMDAAAMLFRISGRKVRRVAKAKNKLKLTPDQKEAVKTALSEKVSIITGGPGSGKTTVLKIIAESFYKAGYDIALASPTGRAAKRLEEVSGFPAKTIHRLLEVDANGNFRKNLNDRLEAEVVIIDESSMIDISLAASLLRAIRTDARLIFVGDCDQLPSVGPGNFFRDLVASGFVPVARLTHIHRQKEGSEIAIKSARLNEGICPLPGEGAEFSFFDYADDDELECDLTQAVEKLASTDFQVLTPIHKGRFGTGELNRRFQKLLNPARLGTPEVTYGETVFRVGDKVMQERNDYELGVMNGSVGVIAQITPTNLVIDFGEKIEYPRDRLENLSLAYAVTVHKSQGSEYDNVILVMAGVTYVMHERNMLYTGMTRAKKHLYIYGHQRELLSCARKNKADARHTNLKNLLGRKKGE